MRRMADSVTPANLPQGFDVYAGYCDGLYNDVLQIKAMFPGKPVLAFTVFATDIIGDYLDVESGDATPAEAPAWIAKMRLAGHPDPGVYCSEALWTTVKGEFQTQGVIEPPYIIAAYPGPGPVMIPGAIGHQWIDHGPYDESVVADYIPGVDPFPIPTAQGDEMIASTPTGNGYWICKPDGSVWSYGDANYLGGTNSAATTPMPAGETATGFASHPTKQGYWIVTNTDAVYAFGASAYHGAPPAM